MERTMKTMMTGESVPLSGFQEAVRDSSMKMVYAGAIPLRGTVDRVDVRIALMCGSR
jgi:hypothetical protein